MVQLNIGKFSLSMNWKNTQNYSDTSPNQLAEQKAADFDKARDIDSLINWIDGITSQMQYLSAANQKEKILSGDLTGFTNEFQNGIDIESLDRNDLTALRPSLEALHNVCQQEDCAVHMSGFDLLPRLHKNHIQLLSGGAYSLMNPNMKVINAKPALGVHIDFRIPYNYHINPFSEAQIRQKFDDLDLPTPDQT